MIIEYNELKNLFKEKLMAHGVGESVADASAKLFADNTLDGVYSHGINRFPRVISYLDKGYIHPDAEPVLIKSFGALERWDGNLGMGNTNASIMMDRAIHLSHKYGIGAVGLRNTNHWMRGGSYGWQAADSGCIGICWTNTINNMPPWGGTTNKIGNNPFVIAIPRVGGEHVVVDCAMSQCAYGKLETLRLKGELLPVDGGYDKDGNLTRNPALIEESRRILPMGYWKGSSLSIALDLAAALLSEGDGTVDISSLPDEIGLSQVFIAIDNTMINSEEFSARLIDSTLAFIESSEPIDGPVRYPGKGALSYRERQLSEGISVDDGVYQTVLSL